MKGNAGCLDGLEQRECRQERADTGWNTEDKTLKMEWDADTRSETGEVWTQMRAREREKLEEGNVQQVQGTVTLVA